VTIPGEILPKDEPVRLFENLEVSELEVMNSGDRPIQVGSHFHFAEANEALLFDRVATRGRHLAVPAGTSVRFEPGAGRSVWLVPFTGDRVIAGFRGHVRGWLDG